MSLLAAALLLHGCATAQAPADPSDAPRPDATAAAETSEASVSNTVKAMMSALEQENAFAFMEHVSERYVPSKFSLKTNVDDSLEKYVVFQFMTNRQDIHIDGDDASVVIHWRRVRSDRQTGDHQVSDGVTELKFSRQGQAAGRSRDLWLLEQQNGDVLFGG